MIVYVMGHIPSDTAKQEERFKAVVHLRQKNIMWDREGISSFRYNCNFYGLSQNIRKIELTWIEKLQ